MTKTTGGSTSPLLLASSLPLPFSEDHMKLGIIMLVILGVAGCSHNIAPPASPVSENGGPPLADNGGFAPLPPPKVQVVEVTPVAPPMVEVQHTEVPCGHEMTVKVGKFNINMPQGGSVEVAGVKAATKQYNIVLEGVEFITRDYCEK